jgi:polyphosphate kinase
MSPAEQLAGIRRQLLPMLQDGTRCWRDDLLPKLKAAGIQVMRYDELKNKQRRLLRRHFEQEIFPALTPLAFDPGHPFPHISNGSINLAVVIDDPDHGERFARVKVPQIFPRFLRIPSEERADSLARLGLVEELGSRFVWIEEVIAANLDLLFPELKVVASYPFRVTRDADLEIEEDEAADLLAAIIEVVGQRHFGSAVRIELDTSMPELIRQVLARNLELQPYQVYELEGPLGRSDLMELLKLDRPDLKDAPFLPVTPTFLGRDESLFKVLDRRDVLLYHPFDSFNPVVDFIREAARDPDVLAIKQTLYRVGPNSPIVQALMEARENGKQVSALVELRARFDEENNIVWARALERAGVHVVYGLLGLKVHAKMCLVVRRERGGIRCYTHLGTGNYNPVTARLYTDLGYFTSDPGVAADVADLFNALTGYSRKDTYDHLLVAPGTLRQEVVRRIHRETERQREHGDGYIAFKMNSLVDRDCIRALYQASQAGVKIDLQVRGICCLRPGVEGVSETITVTSLVGRFLEHSRIYYFANGGDDEMFLGSADLMPRNLDGRVEALFPVRDPRLRRAVREDILFLHLRDNVQTRRLDDEGVYRRVLPAGDEPAVDSQAIRLASRGSWHLEEERY